MTIKGLFIVQQFDGLVPSGGFQSWGTASNTTPRGHSGLNRTEVRWAALKINYFHDFSQVVFVTPERLTHCKITFQWAWQY